MKITWFNLLHVCYILLVTQPVPGMFFDSFISSQWCYH